MKRANSQQVRVQNKKKKGNSNMFSEKDSCIVFVSGIPWRTPVNVSPCMNSDSPFASSGGLSKTT